MAKGARAGQALAIEVDTTVHALLRFRNGCNGMLSASWDVWSHSLPHLEICGTEGALRLPDPNWFGDALMISRSGAEPEPLDIRRFAFGKPTRTLGNGSEAADYRIIRLVDLCRAITEKRRPRLDLNFAKSIFAGSASIAGAAPLHAVTGGEDERPAPLSREEAESWT